MLPVYRLTTRPSLNSAHHVCLSCRLPLQISRSTTTNRVSAAPRPSTNGSFISQKTNEKSSGQDTGNKRQESQQRMFKEIDSLLVQAEQKAQEYRETDTARRDQAIDELPGSDKDAKTWKQNRLRAAYAQDANTIEEILARAAKYATEMLPKSLEQLNGRFHVAAEQASQTQYTRSQIRIRKMRLRAELRKLRAAKQILARAANLDGKSKTLATPLEQMQIWESQLQLSAGLLARDAKASGHLTNKTVTTDMMAMQWISGIEYDREIKGSQERQVDTCSTRPSLGLPSQKRVKPDLSESKQDGRLHKSQHHGHGVKDKYPVKMAKSISGSEQAGNNASLKSASGTKISMSEDFHSRIVTDLKAQIRDLQSQLETPGLDALRREISLLKIQIDGLRSDRQRTRTSETERKRRNTPNKHGPSVMMQDAKAHTSPDQARPGVAHTISTYRGARLQTLVDDHCDRTGEVPYTATMFSRKRTKDGAEDPSAEPGNSLVDLTFSPSASRARERQKDVTAQSVIDITAERAHSRPEPSVSTPSGAGHGRSITRAKKTNTQNRGKPEMVVDGASEAHSGLEAIVPPPIFGPEIVLPDTAPRKVEVGSQQDTDRLPATHAVKKPHILSSPQRTSSKSPSKSGAAQVIEEEELVSLDKMLAKILEEEEVSTQLARAPKYYGIERSPHFSLISPNRAKPLDGARPSLGHILNALGDISRPRLLHTSSRYGRPTVRPASYQASDYARRPNIENVPTGANSIRARLREWQEVNGSQDRSTALLEDYDRDWSAEGDLAGLSQLSPLQDALQGQQLDEQDEPGRLIQAHFMFSSSRDLDGAADEGNQLKMGDLVEISPPLIERNSTVGVFVRRIGIYCQLFTAGGRWEYATLTSIPYSISNWASPDQVEALLPYLPMPESLAEMEEATRNAYVHDLNVPREVAARLVSKLAGFQAEAQDIYRRHANALDNAHDTLSHPTDLRYGSLQSAASVLLKKPPDQISLTALYAVRTALKRAGFGFEIDRRSHRVTGYLQIRSQAQVKTVRRVVQMLRDWQDDKALRALYSEHHPKLRTLKTPATAQAVYDFISKAKKIIAKSRQNRDASHDGNVGPSKIKLPITPQTDAIRETRNFEFTHNDTEFVRFIETWASANMFEGDPRLSSLPPLLLQATGLYESQGLNKSVGFLFLQELGTILPYENKVRFDHHLLLPSSQQSKPLANLMTTVLQMKEHPEFSDSMRHVRHDWGNLHVYCIDAATAMEIDDGISVEAGPDDTWWVRVHIANPTAFFDRDHPLSRMARHMGETIYMPERAHMMLPSWAGKDHFSLGKERPCLTFSVRMDAEGNTIEHDIRSGFVRKVTRLTVEDFERCVNEGPASRETHKTTVLTVGGDPPPLPAFSGRVFKGTSNQIQDMKILQMLAEKRLAQRQRAGGLIYNSRAIDVSVWENWRAPGLKIDTPHRYGSRIVEGDPVIQMRTTGFTNWFAQKEKRIGDTVVQEMMLLACETAGKWCAERQIPVIYRGMLPAPGQYDPEVFFREIIEPAARESPDGIFPPHLGTMYIETLGFTALRTKPFRHRAVGLECYSKATSPLRRYGDMILHWQIEAALREEARTGRSLKTNDPRADRSFLPFSENILSTVMLGLQPREKVISRAKSKSEEFWHKMLLFRAYYYHEAELPFYTHDVPTNLDGTYKDRMRCIILATTASWGNCIQAWNMELAVQCFIQRPERMGLETAQLGDIWECEVSKIDVYSTLMEVTPVRLAYRDKTSTKEVKAIMSKFQ